VHGILTPVIGLIAILFSLWALRKLSIVVLAVGKGAGEVWTPELPAGS
jgi:hypothetical protein